MNMVDIQSAREAKRKIDEQLKALEKAEKEKQSEKHDQECEKHYAYVRVEWWQTSFVPREFFGTMNPGVQSNGNQYCLTFYAKNVNLKNLDRLQFDPCLSSNERYNVMSWKSKVYTRTNNVSDAEVYITRRDDDRYWPEPITDAILDMNMVQETIDFWIFALDNYVPPSINIGSQLRTNTYTPMMKEFLNKQNNF